MIPGKLMALRLTDELDSLVNAECERTGASRSEIVRRAVCFYLKPENLPTEIMQYAAKRVLKAVRAADKKEK